LAWKGELDQIPEADWKLAARRERIIAPLADRDHVTQSEIEQAGEALRLGPAMVFRLLARYRRKRCTSVLVPETRGRKCGSRVLDPSLEKIIETAIKDFYLRREKPSLASLHREVRQACHKAGATPPSYKAIQSRVRDFDPREVITRRMGPKQAAQLLSPVKAGLHVKEPLQLLQMDHTLVDVVVVDEVDREPIGRPWLTLAIDVATRAVPGFHLSLEAPSATSVALALSMAVLPKNKFLAAQHIDFDWPCQGLAKAVHLDNAREFHSNALKRGCQEHGIEITFRPPGRPHFGGHIERLIGTMMGEVHLLPGTTFSSIAARGDYKPADTAVMTMRELERWLTLQITGIYHRSIHRGLGRTPQQAWNQAMKSQAQVRMPHSEQQFYIDFLPCQRRAIRRDGIRMFNIFYWTDSLTTFLHRSRNVCAVHYDPRDLSRVYVKDRENEFIDVPYRTRSFIPITLEEQRWATRKLRSENSAVNEQAMFKAIALRREMVEEAQKKTMRTRRSHQKTAYALQSTVPESSTQSAEEAPEIVGPVQPYKVEIWE
jgi:putative transposase